MTGWQKYKVGDIVQEIAMGPFGSNLKVDNFIESGIPVIRGKNLNYGGFNDNNFVFVSEAKALSLKRCLAQPDDLVFTHRGTLGQVGIIPRGKYPYYLVSQSQMRLTVNQNYLNPKFLYYFFLSPLGQRELLKNASQVGVPAIANPTKSLKDVNIYIPPIETQLRIATVLSSLDNKIELNLQMNKTLEAIAQAIFKEWFVDFRFPGFDGIIVDGLPKQWKEGVISDIYKTTSGGTPSRTREDFYNDGTIKWVKSKELNGSFIFDTEEMITEEALIKSSAKIIPEYSVLVAMYGATVGEHAILSKKATCNQAICAIIPNYKYPYTYILLHLRMRMDSIIDQSSGSAQQNISQALIQRQKIIIPPPDIVKKFHEIVNPLFAIVENNVLANSTLRQIRDSLLPKLMTGKIRVV